MNVITLTGNATKDLELKYTPSGTATASGVIAVRQDFKNKQTGEYGTDFINFTAFGKTGEIMAQYINKGDKFGINGRLQIRKYEQNGDTKYFTEVVVNGFDFPDRKNSESNNQAPKKENYTRLDQDPFQGSGPIEVSDEDLPF